MTSPAVQWLLASEEPAIGRLARRDLLGERVGATPMDGPKVRGLLHGLDDETVHPYAKWDGAHWRLVSLVELEVPADDRLTAAANRVLDWLTSDRHRSSIRATGGLTRVHASQEGNALAVCCGLGMASDPRVGQLASDLVEWQWPDGGWNCDPHASGRRSSFHESLIPAHGLHEYAEATNDEHASRAASRTAELLLDHRLFRRTDTGEPIHEEWLRLHHPTFWHYDILHALVILARMGRSGDPRAGDALDVLRQRRLKDGRWRAGGSWVRGSQRGPNEMITLNALRVLGYTDSR